MEPLANVVHSSIANAASGGGDQGGEEQGHNDDNNKRGFAAAWGWGCLRILNSEFFHHLLPEVLGFFTMIITALLCCSRQQA